MNPSSRPHLSVNQQEHSSSQKGARLRFSLKNVPWQLQPFPCLLELDEQQACSMKSYLFWGTIIWEQREDVKKLQYSPKIGNGKDFWSQ